FECNACGKGHSVTAGTVLHRCRVPLATVVRVAWILSSDGSCSARGIARIFGLAVETAWSLCHRLRSGFLAHDRQTALQDPLLLSPYPFKLRPPYHQKRPKDQRF